MKTPKTFTIYDLRFTIGKKSSGAVNPLAQGAQAPGRSGAVNRQSPIANRQSQAGIALVITLIMLSVTLLMAVAFLALAKRERGSVSTGTDTAMAQQAARAAVDQAQAQILANILSGFSGLDSSNAYNLSLLVSTNYINSAGFNNRITYVNPTNVNYVYANGTPLSAQDFQQNVANLYYLPRAPVFVPSSTSPLTYDFRYYLDLNQNGRFDTNGWQTVFSGDPANPYYDLGGHPTPTFNPPNVLSNFFVGDPEWIGVLERPDAPHGPNNHFIARYAYIAVPAGNAMDVNYIHNQALNTKLGVSDGYFRNQGVGAWEINLAAFLADLNTNQWSPIALPANLYYAYNEANNPSTPNLGYTFQDALSLLKYRYNSNSLPAANLALGNTVVNANRMLAVNGIDSYSRGPLQTTLDYNRTLLPPAVSALNGVPWSGANNTNHYFTPGDLLDGSKIGTGLNSFTNRLRAAGNGVSSYDRYTYYRMLSQLGSDSSPDDGKLNLNYANAVVNYKTVKGVSVPASIGVVLGMETNLVPWRPLDFFHAAADQLLRLYTTNWFQTSPTNFLTTYYGYIPRGYVDATGLGVTNFPIFGLTNQIPAFGITNIPVMVNGSFVYSPAVNRLLQFAANLYDASTNNNYNLPHVFRPIMEHDQAGNVFIVGYTEVARVTGTGDPRLAAPIVLTPRANFGTAYTPFNDGSGSVNVYGVPWIIGAKKGLPNFNQFSMLTAAQVTRQLEVTRSSLDTKTATYSTNQTYIIGISNSLGVTFWNSYSNTYYPHSGNLTVYTYDYSTMLLTNGRNQWPVAYPYVRTFVTNSWPGSQWSGTPPNALPQASSFITNNWWYLFQSPLPYDFLTARFDALNLWQPTSPRIPQLPQFGLMVTNYLQAYILDGNNVIDYVQLRDPVSVGGLNQSLADPNYPDGTSALYQWSTNTYPSAAPTPYGVVNQITVSRTGKAPAYGGQWRTDPTPMGINTPAAEAAFFNGFFQPTFQYGGKPYANREFVIQAPYVPSRCVYSSYLLQANDPLVHYISSDMNSHYGSLAMWSEKLPAINGVWAHSDDPLTQPVPKPPLSPIGGRYQPWGNPGQVASASSADSNPYNLAYKDPLAWGSDSWDFPTNLYPTVGWIGRVHRGTPWQTVNLKSTNILWYVQNRVPIGSNTWAAWSGDIAQSYYGLQYYDAANSAPMEDRLLFDIFTTRFNDNAVRGTLPVNQTQLASWSAVLSGMVAVTNTGLYHKNSQVTPIYTTEIITPAGVEAANSVVSNVVANINATRSSSIFPYHAFTRAGDLLFAPALSIASPYLDQSTAIKREYGVSDEMYEWLPQQMMGLVRGTEQRYVLYCWGQALRPAPGGKVLSGAYAQMVTNYQVVAESAVRAVMRVDNAHSSQPHAVVETYNVLPPE